MPSLCRQPLVISAVAAVLVCMASTGAFVSADDPETVSEVTTTAAPTTAAPTTAAPTTAAPTTAAPMTAAPTTAAPRTAAPTTAAPTTAAPTTAALMTAAPTTAAPTTAAPTTAPTTAPRRCTLANLTTFDVIKLSVLIRDHIYCFGNTTDEDGVRYHALIAGFMRIAFHSSIDRTLGGCINLQDGRQAGMRVAVEELEKLYQQSLADPYYAKVSRADFWALAGVVALEQSTAGNTMSVTYRYGRCDACVDTFDTNATLDLPSQTFSGEQVVAYLYKLFQLTDREAVALMGAHSLGRVSNFGKWVLNPEALSNGYFANMVDPDFHWKQVKRTFPLEQPSEIWSWTHGSDKRVYLNCDMGLFLVLNATADGKSSCSYDACELSPYYKIVLEYKNNAATFRFFFRSAFDKMINGNGVGLRTPI